MLITVFTPTYNRAPLLQRLYESLCIQSFHDFEWLIVDDGSQDDTEKIIGTFIAENKMVIRYIKQSNGGKHRAINHGVAEARGELFFIVDSDDSLPSDSLQIIHDTYIDLREVKTFGGLSGLDGNSLDGRVIGSGLGRDKLDCSIMDIEYKYQISGDMAEVFRTDVMKEFPFPEYENEKFCPEDLVWHRIATKYKLRYINKVIYIAEYQPDGLTAKIVKIRMDSPMASMTYYSELIVMEIPFIQKIKAAINYWRFRFCSKNAEKPKISNSWIWSATLGYMMHLNDLRK
jgi:glycosyltransferase involved in cell wall biosynthesis